MTQQILTPSIIAKEALFQLENNMVMGNLVHRDYKKEFVKVGETVSIRKPVKFEVVDGAARTNQDVEEASTNITVNKRKHVSWQFSTQDMTLSIERYSERYIKPAMIALANKCDRDLCDLYKQVWNWVGTPGQTINSFADLSKAPERLDEMAVPMSERNTVLSPADSWGMISNLTGLGLTDQSTSPQQQAYREARLGRVARSDMYQDQNVRRHSRGTADNTTPLVDGASQTTTYDQVLTTYSQTLITDGWDASSTLKEGDIITIAGVFSVNPVPGELGTGKDALDFLQHFVITADVTANATTTLDTNLTISPPIITSGPYQTVSAAPADDAVITLLGTASTNYAQNMMFHKNAFALVMCPLEMPDSATWKARMTHNNVSVRLIKFYDGDNDKEIIRCDILYGLKAIYPELATRISGTA